VPRFAGIIRPGEREYTLPLRLVENIEQLAENALRFDSYRSADPGSVPREFWEKKMKSGRSFLHLISLNGDIFCPSMFAGYRGNSMEMAAVAAQDMDGRVTNRQINRILGAHQSHENSKIALQNVFERYNLSGGWPEPWFWVLNEEENGTYASIANDGNSIAVGQQPVIALEHPINRIFYGPPGTGKTYHTVNAALAIMDPDFDESRNRSELMNRFEELKNEGRIEFVTFHQSFSYEEFVEGLKATTSDNGQIAYEVQDGIFKILCERARAGKAYLSVDQALDQLKEDCSEEPVTMQTTRGREIKVSYPGKTTFHVDPVEGKSTGNPVNINSIRKVMLGEDSKGIYHIHYIKAIIAYIEDKYKISGIAPSDEQAPYILIIDEINRGNISRIFGELITLIEPSKRAGAEDALSVTLPYSGESFSVPKNLYIIGTMNTADRSIALLDTALRRRFRFEEMMPDLTLLDGVTVEDVEIRELLSVMNKRIEALYDRDHQIGHSYFLPLEKNPSLARLSDIFRHSVLPLLQEYFYEDWEKIDLVLNHNGFLNASKPPDGLNLDSEKKLWRIDEKAFGKAEKYQKIYGG